MSAKHHWHAEKSSYRPSRSYRSIMALYYDPTPGGKRNEDGSTSFSMNFPAALITEYVADPDKVAGQLVERLNAFDGLVEALAGMLDFWGGYECPEVDAAIAVMQQIGKDRWSMQAQMDAAAAGVSP